MSQPSAISVNLWTPDTFDAQRQVRAPDAAFDIRQKRQVVRAWSCPRFTGRPATLTRLVAGLLYLQHAYALSDEAVVARWAENPYWQHSCGETFFQHRLPLDPSSLTRWRQRIGEEGVETVKIFISGARRGVTRTIAKLLRRRSAIEPMIGHMKNDGRLTRCPLKGTEGDALFAVLCGCGHNIRMILRHLRAVVRQLIWLIRQVCMIIDADTAPVPRDQIDRLAA